MADDTRYAYAVSRIRAIEKKLLDKNGIDRMADAKTPEEALKVVIEAGYGSSAGEAASVYDYEKLLLEEQKKVYRLLKEIAPYPELFDIFLLQNDYHNLKAILKSEFSGQDDKELLVDAGLIPVNKLKMMVKDRSFSDMHDVMRRAVEECLDTFNRTKDPQSIDLIMDRASFEHMSQLAESAGNGFVKGLVSILADLANIKIFLRVKRLNKSWDFLQKFLVPGGMIDKKLYIDCIGEPLEVFMNALSFKPYSVLLDGIESFKTTGSLTKFEKLADNYIMNYVKKARFVTFGVEPLIGYLVAKENEIKNIRIIMVGKINGISPNIIRERLRETYV